MKESKVCIGYSQSHEATESITTPSQMGCQSIKELSLGNKFAGTHKRTWNKGFGSKDVTIIKQENVSPKLSRIIITLFECITRPTVERIRTWWKSLFNVPLPISLRMQPHPLFPAFSCSLSSSLWVVIKIQNSLATYSCVTFLQTKYLKYLKCISSKNLCSRVPST